MVRKLGAIRFALAFSLAACGCLIGLSAALMLADDTAFAMAPIAQSGVARALAAAMVVIGLMLVVAGFAAYADAPAARLARQAGAPRPMPRRPPLERLVRHPLFTGLAFFGLGHALLATHQLSALHHGCLFAFCVTGVLLQDRKFAQACPEQYRVVVEQTPLVPFARFWQLTAGDWRALLWPMLLAGVVTAGAGLLHPWVQSGNGALLLLVMVAGGLVNLLLQFMRRSRPLVAPSSSGEG